jgi:hypothetical protein
VQPEPYSAYLARRGSVVPWSLDFAITTALLPGAIVIPCLAESALLHLTLASLSADSSLTRAGLAVVVVVNNRLEATAEEKADNQLTLDYLKTIRGRLSFPLGIVDAASPGLELPLKDGGVGLARKLGHDLVLPFLDYRSDPLLISLDADTLVQPGYADAIINHFRSAVGGGAVIPFEHIPAEGERAGWAIERYELFLRCYVAGLNYAGSPYAFHTVGSAMACRASAYLKCGGMNRRRAGEDFYFLQSLAKTSGVEQVQGTVVYPSPRRSNRVPFGTGRAVGAMLDNASEAIRFHRPECFHLLKAWLELAMNACTTRESSLCAQAEAVSANLGGFLEEQKFDGAWQRFLRQHDAPESLHAAFHGWFDAFRTMKLCHYCADADLPRTEPEEVVASFPQAWGEAGLSMGERLNFLRKMQG